MKNEHSPQPRQDTTAQATIRKVQPEDNMALAQVIRDVMLSYGLDRPGTAFYDAEISSMYESYQDKGKAYFVACIGDKVLGGAGIGPLAGEDECCSLNRMYLLPEARGLGLGQALLELCLEAAKEFGYHTCYAETLSEMTKAQRLYEANGFVRQSCRAGNTGYHHCDVWLTKTLDD